MATAVEPLKTARKLEAEQRVVLRGVGWEGYETLLRMVGDGHVRLACDGEDVELMSPSRDHEAYAALIGRIIDTVTEELDIPCQSLRSTTWRKRAKEKGLEADDCYYLSSLDRIRGKRGNLDLAVDPPPDLAVEVEISRSALNRMEIYAALGVPEVWRFDGEIFTVQLLRADRFYELSQSSRAFGFLPIGDIPGRLLDAQFPDEMRWGKACRAWVRDVVAPHFRDDPR
jgi:Uma2 family endonuclease